MRQTNNRKGNNNRLSGWRGTSSLSATGAASGDGGHDGDVITVFEGGSVFLEITHVLVVDIDIHKGAEFAVLCIEMTPQVGMLADQGGKRFAHGCGWKLHRSLLPGILAQGRGNMNLRHRPERMPQGRRKIHRR